MANFNLAHQKKHAGIAVLNNCRLIDPESYTDISNCQLVIKDGLIVDFGRNVLDLKNNSNHDITEVFECNGNILVPGLIDIQVHLRDPGQKHKEDMSTGTKSAVSGGVTTVACQPNTKPVIDSDIVLEYIKSKQIEAGYCNVFSYACVTKGMKGEELSDMMCLKSAGAVGFTDDGLPVMNSMLMRRALEHSKELNVVIAQHAEDLTLSAGGCINEGEISEKLRVKGQSSIAESIMVQRDISLLEKYGGHYHVLHISTKESLDAVRRAKIKGLSITCEASPHHFTLNESAVLSQGVNAKMNPPLRSEEDRLAVLEAIKEGLVDAIATDHAPHDFSSKELPLSDATFGIVGLETMLPLSLELHYVHGVPLLDVLAKLTFQPANIIRSNRGRIKKGAIADLTLIDASAEYSFQPDQTYSKSQNSPFFGRKMRGRAIKTFVGGALVYDFES